MKIKWATVSNVAGHDKAERLYNAGRYCWAISSWEAQHVLRHYVLSVIDDVVQEVNHVQKWDPAPGCRKKQKYEFTGEVAEESVRSIFRDKKIPDCYYKKGNRASFLKGKSCLS